MSIIFRTFAGFFVWKKVGVAILKLFCTNLNKFELY